MNFDFREGLLTGRPRTETSWRKAANQQSDSPRLIIGPMLTFTPG